MHGRPRASLKSPAARSTAGLRPSAPPRVEGAPGSGAAPDPIGGSGAARRAFGWGARRRCSVPCRPLAAVRHRVSGLPQHLEDPQCRGPPTPSSGWGEPSSPPNLKSICWGLNPVAPRL